MNKRRRGGKRVAIFVLLCACVPGVFAQTAGEFWGDGVEGTNGAAALWTLTAGDSAQALLDDVTARLPREPLRITGRLIRRRRRGVVEREMGFETLLRWGAEPAEATYTIRDAFGHALEQMRVTRRAGARPGFAYARGDPLRAAPLPDLTAAIQETDVSWLDLTLSFLWWRGAVVSGVEKVKGFECYVVDAPAPAGDGAGGGELYARVRLWIDRQHHMLLQAEGYDVAGQAVRRLWIESFKKMGERWMIKDMEIQHEGSRHRTKLRVDDAQVEKKP